VAPDSRLRGTSGAAARPTHFAGLDKRPVLVPPARTLIARPVRFIATIPRSPEHVLLYSAMRKPSKRENEPNSLSQSKISFLPLAPYVFTSLPFILHFSAEHLRCPAIQRYAVLRDFLMPGTFANQTTGRPHQISPASATAASAPP
jgi:hypothetical protein